MAEKLVRDYIPSIIAGKGEKVPPMRVASRQEMFDLVLAKLKEEVAEFEAAWAKLCAEKDLVMKVQDGKEEDAYEVELANEVVFAAIEEAADIVEVLGAALNIEQVLKKMAQKKQERGGFRANLVLNFPDA